MKNPSSQKSVAYFSMEVGLEDAVATYSGGLGVLAGDTLKAAADAEVPVTGITLLHHRGYLRQLLAADGTQTAEPVDWNPDEHLDGLTARCEVEVEGRRVQLGAWRYVITGCTGHEVPVIFLDADLPENAAEDRRLTDRLYGGDERYRLAQEVILGVGGRRMLAALECKPDIFHLNEGHAALASLELLRERIEAGQSKADAVAAVREMCVFTTHTPVPAGHDRFPLKLAKRMIAPELWATHAAVPDRTEKGLNMTEVALGLSGWVNGVAQRHAEVSRAMFPGREIHGLTNGVHHPTWCSPAFAGLFDRWIPGWRGNGFRLRGAEGIPGYELLAAHRDAKRALVSELKDRGHAGFSSSKFTIGFARRATPYKRASLLFEDLPRLQALAEAYGGIQVVYAGKAHPKDVGGQALIREIHALAQQVGPNIQLAYLQNYGMRLGGLITAGVDIWLNTPRAPMEASGTSGMKAVLNGVPNLSIDDGWWCEGGIHGVTGWVIDPATAPKGSEGPKAEALVDAKDAARLYEILEEEVLPLFDGDATGWATVMRGAIALSASYFHAQRMIEQYRDRAYNRQQRPAGLR
jgi:starch phosphorylase